MKKNGLVNIQEINPRIKVELKYATSDNLMKKVMYDFKKCLLQKEAAAALSRAQEEVETLGLGFKVWDGYRPIAVQWEFWNLLPDERYISHPLKGGRHPRGTAVDLTLITADGKELEMPTPFDEMSEKAHVDNHDVTKEAEKNRAFLQEIMKKHGFLTFETEWWHFDYQGWESFDPVDLADIDPQLLY